ncbi:MAG: hypothetical protein KIT84_17585 [Labilithrix sp.]|nr:hypothetical protein [Labilithrix sp.]MCW5812845.1 hypothetical protein [Labilithrix sp.]
MKPISLLAVALCFVTGCTTIIEQAPKSKSKSKTDTSDPAEIVGDDDSEDTSGPDPDPETKPRDEGLGFGTLLSISSFAADEMKAGITTAMLEVRWGVAEPEEGRFDTQYLTQMASVMDKHRKAGRSITLGVVLHDTPRWVLALPNGRYVDDLGNTSDRANFVFNQRVRDAAERFIREMVKTIPLAGIDRLRVASGGSGEVLYPGGGTYWAFDRNAQNGPDLPPTMAKNPLPGWKPGNGATPQEVRSWAEWYVGGLDDVVRWQMDLATALGFEGRFEVLTPGMGVRSAEWEDAIAKRLPRGLLGIGPAWQVFYSKLGPRRDVIAYVSSVADRSGGDDGCEPGDASIGVTDAKTTRWSATRYIARLAAEYGYGLSGENPGFADAAAEHYRDLSPSGMLAASLRQARTCGMTKLYWAHDDRLWNGTIAFPDFAKAIAAPY